MSNLLKPALAAGALVVGLLPAAVSHAGGAPVAIKSTGIYAPGLVDVSGLGTEWATAVDFNAVVGSAKAAQTLYAFCIDLTHDILVNPPQTTDIVTARSDNQYVSGLSYVTATLAYDSSGMLSGGADGLKLSSSTVHEIADLASIGRGLITTDLAAQAHGTAFDGADLSDRLAAIQGAIWKIEYPGRTVTAENATVETELNRYVKLANPSFRGSARTIYDVTGAHQGFIVGSLPTPGGGVVGGVPEPATWGLMIVGLGLAGATLRRRRGSGLVAA